MSDIVIEEDMSPKLALQKLVRVNHLWNSRAAVKQCEMDFEAMFNDERGDYPPDLVPFLDHPNFDQTQQEKRNRFMSWAWIAYNKHINDGETFVAGPAFLMMTSGELPIFKHEELQQAALHGAVDESYHILLHAQANLLTRKKEV